MGDSIWKKEISFKKKDKEPNEPTAETEPNEADDANEAKPSKGSFWKKEVSFGKKKERELERLTQRAAEAVEAVSLPVDPIPHPTALAEAFVAAMPDPEPAALTVVPASPLELVPVESVSVELPPVASDPVELPPIALAPPELPSVELPPDLPSLTALPTAQGESWPQPEATPLELAEPWLAEPAVPSAPVAPAVTIHPPVPAAELPPIVDVPARTPFWKKELSLSRKAKAAKTAEAPLQAPKEKGAPFWKKELSLSRKAKAEKTAEAPLQAPKEKGAPFWKRELSLGRKPKGSAVDAPTEQLPAAPKVPLHKRKLSMSSLSLPKLPSRGGAKGGHSAKRLVGLKIGASQLAAARISNNGVAELQQIARAPLAHGVVVAGELRDPEALGAALKVFFARNKLPKKGVRLGIASNRIGVRILEIVGVEEEKLLANAVQFRAQEALPIPLDEAVLDYRVLDTSVDADGQTVKRVLLVVVYRELIERYVSACRKAGINLAGIDLEAFALLRSLGAPADRAGSALVAVAIGHDRSTFAVSDGRICEFTRVVEWGGSALNVALARAFDSTPSEVETIKRELSLDGSTSPADLTPEQTTVALDAVRRQVQSFARELVSSLQFYQNQPGSLGIGEIVLTGGTAHLPGLAEELERLIGVHVRVGDPFARLKVGKKFAGTDQIGSFAVAIGLGIED
jgi:type IV pilus assembly protein PilM